MNESTELQLNYIYLTMDPSRKQIHTLKEAPEVLAPKNVAVRQFDGLVRKIRFCIINKKNFNNKPRIIVKNYF